MQALTTENSLNTLIMVAGIHHYTQQDVNDVAVTICDGDQTGRIFFSLFISFMADTYALLESGCFCFLLFERLTEYTKEFCDDDGRF